MHGYEGSRDVHYALVDGSGMFVAEQGSESWKQDRCIGWAVCSADRDWVISKETDNLLMVEVWQAPDGSFRRHGCKGDA